MSGNTKTNIGYQAKTPCDASNPVFVSSSLEDDLVVTAEPQGNFIDFTLGAQKWPNNGDLRPGDTQKLCSVGDWDCSNFPCVS